MRHDIYFLYSDPIGGSRTGHTAILITRAYGNGNHAEIVYYFSMYHASLPNDVRNFSLRERVTRSIAPAFVNSYHDDVIMRGQSRAKYNAKKEKNVAAAPAENFPKSELASDPTENSLKNSVREDDDSAENITVPDILEALKKLSPEEKKRYLDLGQFRYVVKLSDKLFEPYALIGWLDVIMNARNSYGWTMCSPLAGFFFNTRSHNCCSAISEALSVSKTEYRSETFAVAITKAVFVAGIFALCGLSNNQDENKTPLINYLLIIPAMLALESIYHAHLYFTDLKAMAKKSESDWLTLISVYLLCVMANVLASPFTSNLCANLFLFPGALARSLKSVPGATEISAQYQPRFFSQLPEQGSSDSSSSAAAASSTTKNNSIADCMRTKKIPQ